MFRDAARLAFGPGSTCVAVPEVRLLEVKRKERISKIGKVDFLLAKLVNGEAVDFAALEVQAVYISGKTIRPAYERYLRTGSLSEASKRRPDYRSSAQKRLMPQLALKVPIFRRWGKRFFVVVDQTFFNELPSMRAQSAGNGEITWLSYDIAREKEGGFSMKEVTVTHTIWDDVQDALREGKAPEQQELLAQLTKESKTRRKFET